MRGPEVMRVLPRTNEAINEEWLSDKSRYAVDGLMRQRLDKPMVRGKDGKLAPVSWNGAFAAVEAKLKGADPKRVGVIAGDLQDAESMKAALDLFRSLGVANIDCRDAGSPLGGAREGYIFNTTIAGLDQVDALLLVGSNPRVEASVLNARIRKNWLSRGMKVGAHRRTRRANLSV